MDQPLYKLSALELSARLRRRELSVTETLNSLLDRIEHINPTVNAIVTLCESRARATAARLERDFDPAGKPLYGVPIAVKDLSLTAGVRTTFGSPLYRDYVPDIDELFVERLKAAGAILIGKTNTPEFGAGSQTFNTIFGATRNPYDLSKTCGGSSGGAAVALACGLLPLADGSDLGGSLRNPAAFCNVVGLRPSPGRVPSWPNQLSSDQLAVHGPMARSVADLALLLSVMAGPDPRVPISLPEAGTMYRRELDRDFSQTRVAYSPNLGHYEVDAAITEVLQSTAGAFETLGCKVDAADPDLSDADEIFKTLRAWLFAARFGATFERDRTAMKDTLIWNIEQGLALTVEDITAAETARSQLLARIAQFFESFDFLVCASTQVPPFDIDKEWVTHINGVEMETYLDWMGVCYAITVTGCPAISVPAGFTASGLPVGVQIVAPRWRDFELLQIAHALETATGFGRRPPMIF